MGRKVAFYITMWTIVIVVALSFIEGLVRVLIPQPALYPRFRHSEQFGHALYASATIVNELPGAWRFVYHTNEYGFRVGMPAISNRYDQPNIVVLGDSYAFGHGVNDGEEYCAILSRALAGEAQVVNLGVGGFGLTHEIRAFYEFGVLFQPDVVVLQFTGNDPDDNFYERVTTVRDGRFEFHRDTSTAGLIGGLKNWLSNSFLQRSEAYNYIRNHAYAYWRERTLGAADSAAKQAFYNQLLLTFAEDLRRRNIFLVVFAVNGQLTDWPQIAEEIKDLGRQGLLQYLPSEPWFADVSDYGTPEGHLWGAKGHRIVAEHLLAPLRAVLHRSVTPSKAGQSD